ncbi:MAG: PA0069 family radical SAM protein [Myxococcota bacterium]
MQPNRPGSGPPPAAGAAIRGRGTAENPPNRFERLTEVADGEFLDSERLSTEFGDSEHVPRVRTAYFRDSSRTIIAFNKSPDLHFDASLNPYRGCEHGCIYCYARPSHEYLGFSAGLEFESKILVKTDAPRLLRDELASPGWKPQVVAVGANTDSYQPIEARLRITRGCLEVFAEFRNPVAIVTKGSLVIRDCDVLAELAACDAAAVNVSITTLDRDLSRIMEPRAATPHHRLETVADLASRKIPVGVMLAPIIPGLTDHEIPAIVEAATRAGAQWIAHVVLRLPHGVGPLFEAWLQRHFPERASKVMNRVRELRGGRTNDPRFHTRMRGEGVFADQIHSMMALALRRAGTPNDRPMLSTDAFRRAPDTQLSLFG